MNWDRVMTLDAAYEAFVAARQTRRRYLGVRQRTSGSGRRVAEIKGTT